MELQKIWDWISEESRKFSWKNWRNNLRIMVVEKRKCGGVEDPPQESKQTENRAISRKNVQNAQHNISSRSPISQISTNSTEWSVGTLTAVTNSTKVAKKILSLQQAPIVTTEL